MKALIIGGRVNKKEIINNIDEIIDTIPVELRTARWIVREQESFITKAKDDSVKSYLVESGINSLLLEVVEKGETEKVVEGRTYESGRRVEFELR